MIVARRPIGVAVPCHACGSYDLRPTHIGANAECRVCEEHTLIDGPCEGLPRWVRNGRCSDCGRPSEPMEVPA